MHDTTAYPNIPGSHINSTWTPTLHTFNTATGNVVTPENVYGKNPDFPNLALLPLPDGIAVRVANAVVWNGGEFVGLTLIRERDKPAQDAAMIMRSYLAGDGDRIQKLRNPSGLMPESIAIFFHLWDLPPIEWTFFDVPSPVTDPT